MSTPSSKSYFVLAIYGYVLLHPNYLTEALDALLPTGMGSMATELAALVTVS